MHEHDPSGQSPHQQLIDLLSADFSPPQRETESSADEDNALSQFLSHAVSAEEVDERFYSPESLDLREQSEILLRPTKTTIAFRMFVTDQICLAYAYQTRVNEGIYPQRLGLTTGEGIFDASQAQGIEAQVIRGHAFDLVNRYLIAPDSDDPDIPPLVPRPGINPDIASGEFTVLNRWAEDFQEKYGEDPFEGTREAYGDAAPRAGVIDSESDDNGWTEFVQRLNQLRQQGEPE